MTFPRQLIGRCRNATRARLDPSQAGVADLHGSPRVRGRFLLKVTSEGLDFQPRTRVTVRVCFSPEFCNERFPFQVELAA
jgi:hypothetical protein